MRIRWRYSIGSEAVCLFVCMCARSPCLSCPVLSCAVTQPTLSHSQNRPPFPIHHSHCPRPDNDPAMSKTFVSVK